MPQFLKPEPDGIIGSDRQFGHWAVYKGTVPCSEIRSDSDSIIAQIRRSYKEMLRRKLNIVGCRKADYNAGKFCIVLRIEFDNR